MLEKMDLKKTIGKDEYDSKLEVLSVEIAKLQREAKTLGIPVVVLFEGFGASGKGTLINQLMRSLDPRGFIGDTTEEATDDELLRP